jgi:MarR family transcriptional regulator, organic hydroperoxide resistance regulator
MMYMATISMYSTSVLDLDQTPTPGFLVWRLSLRWRAAVDRAVAPLGLTHAQYSLLASLSGVSRAGQRPSQRELADHTGLDPIYVSKLARALEASDLVARRPDPDDSRAVRLGLTERGQEVARRAVTVVAALQDELTAPLGGVGSERTRALVETLHTLLAAPLVATETGETP